MDRNTIELEALGLPPEERAKLAQTLLLSLEELSESELEQEWLAEAARRARDLDSGRVKPVSAEEVRRKAREMLR